MSLALTTTHENTAIFRYYSIFTGFWYGFREASIV